MANQQDIKQLTDKLVNILEEHGDKELIASVAERLVKLSEPSIVRVQTAGELGSSEQKDLESKMFAKFPEAEEVVFEANSNLIAGLRVSYKDYVYEDSVNQRLQQIRNN